MTPEQIESFNARAASGEKPVLKWDGSEHRADFVFGGESVLLVDDFQCGNPGWWVAHNYERIGPFSSLAAAQLAAEHMLREAAAPLFAGALDEIRQEFACCEGGDPDCHVGGCRAQRQYCRQLDDAQRAVAALEAKLVAFGEAWDEIEYGLMDEIAHGSGDTPRDAQRRLDEMHTLDPRRAAEKTTKEEQ